MGLIIRRAKIVGQEELMDIEIRGDKIVGITPTTSVKEQGEVDAQGNLVSAGFVDPHIHLDKVFLLERLRYKSIPRKAEARGILWCEAEACVQRIIDATNELKREFTVEDVRERARRAALMACANGTTALRAQVDVDPVVRLKGVKGVLEVKRECRHLVDIQVVAFPQNGIFTAPGTEELLREAVELGADVIGGIPALDPEPERHIDLIFDIAKEHDLDIDMHVDQVYAPKPLTLPYLAEKTVREGYQGRVVADHCYALAAAPPEVVWKTIEKVKEAGISICVQPLRMRIPRMREPLDAGVNMAFFTDNLRDTWDPYGNADMLENALLFAQMTCDSSIVEEDFLRVFDMATLTAAKIIGLEYGVEEGKKADLVVLEARSPEEAIVTQAQRLHVIKGGEVVAVNGRIVSS
ncbi:MAG: amidohydrolase family protein [Candidatus Bathyarchaeia archaeon]